MKKATEIFSAEEISSLNQAVARAEQQTSGEIVCVVAARSDDYPRAEDIAGIWLGLLLVAVCWYIFSRPPSGSWGPALLEVDWKLLLAGLVVFLVGFILGAILADRLPLLKKLFIGRRLMRERVEQAAARLFFQNRVSCTRQRTGILIYISLFERMVRVLGDVGIAEKLSDADWYRVRDLIISGMRSGKPADGMKKAIELCGQKLAAHFPRPAEDTNELPDQIIFID
jgi:putative membrane protein